MANSYRYPLQRIDQTSDYLKIQVIKYEAPGIDSGGGLGFQLNRGSETNRVSGEDQKKRIQGTIYLPIPEGLTDMNATNWDGGTLDPLSAAATDTLMDVVKQFSLDDKRDFGQKVSGALDTLKSTGNKFIAGMDERTQDAVMRALLSQVVNVPGQNVDINSLTSRAQGIVLNPNLELLFKGVVLRSFNFNYSLTPRSRAESNQVKSIINTFKRRMAAKTTASTAGSAGLFLSSPDVFQLEFMRGGQPHPFLFKMNTCALKTMNVNYAGTGAYATYEDSTPVKMTMSLQFQELSPVYAEDYAENTEDGVGF